MKAGGGSTPGPLFFSLEERTAAAALLLLLSSAPTTTFSSSSASTSSAASSFAVDTSKGRDDGVGSEEEEGEEPSPSSSTSSSSSSCVSDSSRAVAAVAEVQADPLRLLARAVRCLELKRKVVRKARSVVLYGSIRTKGMDKDCWTQQQQLLLGKQHLEEDPVASCLSSASTAAALGGNIPFPTSSFSGSPFPPWSPQMPPPSTGHGSGIFSRPSPPPSPVSGASAGTSSSHRGGRRVVMKMRRVEGNYVVVGGGSDAGAMICGSNGLRRRANAILEFLRARCCTSEVRIRAAIGDSPDTSKALRMLLKLDLVRRSGTGGRHDPFLYWVSGPGGGRTPRTTAQLGTGAQVPPFDSG